MFARFFIDRPIFAWVLSLVIILGGVVAVLFLPIDQYPDITPPTVTVTATYPGANAQEVADTIAAPIEEAGQRRREHDVHVVAIDQRRPVRADRHLRDRHRPEHGPGAGPEPRLAGPAAAAVAGADARRHHQEEIAQHSARRQPDFARQQLRRALPQQLRDDPTPRRVAAHQGRRRHYHLRRARLRHAALARPEQTGDPRPDGRGRGQRHQESKRPGRRRAGRPGAGPVGSAVPAADARPRPARDGQAVRRHHPQDRPAAGPTGATGATRDWPDGDQSAGRRRSVIAAPSPKSLPARSSTSGTSARSRWAPTTTT